MTFADLLRRLRKPQLDAPPVPPARRYEYHAVSVVPDPSPCKVAMTERGRRYLSQDAPRLPLPACTKPETCHCRFAHFNDRRREERRDILSFSRWYAGTDRRRGPGRRSSDR